MADEPIGDLSVRITGDFSELQGAIDNAAAAAEKGAQTIADAFNDLGAQSGLSGGSLNLFTQALDQMQKAGLSAQQALQQLAASASTVGPAVAAAADALLREQEAAQAAAAATRQVQQAFDEIGGSINAAGGQMGLFEEATNSALGGISQMALFDKNSIDAMDTAFGSLGQNATAALAPLAESGGLWASITNGLTSIGDSISNLIPTWRELFAAFIAYDIGKAIVGIADQFQEATQRIVATTGEVGTQLDALKGTFDNLFAEVPQGAADVADAIGIISQRLDLAGQDLENFSKAVLDVSTITGEAAAKIADNVTKAFNGWKVGADQATQELTNLLNIAQSAAMPLDSLLSDLEKYGPVLREMGLSMDDAALMLANLTKEGIPAQQVIFALRTEMTKLAKEGVPDVNGALVEWVQHIKDAATESDALAIASSAGARGATGLTDAIRSGALNLDDFTGKLKLANTSIADQKAAAETLGQTWTTVLHRMEEDLGATHLASFLKMAGDGINLFLVAPLKSVELAWKEMELIAAEAIDGVLTAVSKIPLAKTLFPSLISDTAALDTFVHNTKIDLDELAQSIMKAANSASTLKPKIDDIPAPHADVVAGVAAIGAAFEQTTKQEEGLARETAAIWETFQKVMNTDLNESTFKSLEELDTKLEKIRQDYINAGVTSGIAWTQIGQDIAAVQQRIQDLADYNLAHLQDAMDKMWQTEVAGTQKFNDTWSAAMQKAADAAFALGNSHPFDALSAAMKDLGVTSDGLTAKMSKDLHDFDVIVHDSGASLSAVEEGWQKVQQAIARLATDPAGMATVLKMEDAYLADLDRMHAPLQAQQQAYINILAENLKIAETQGNSADEVTRIGIALEIAKDKQAAFNDQLTGELKLFDNIDAAFGKAWTDFGTGIADAITGSESFGQAMTKVLGDLEKKLAELVTNYLLGMLKDAFLQNTTALESFGSVFNSIFGSSGGGGGGAAAGGLPLGGLMSGGNSSQQLLGSVAGGAQSAAGGVAQLGSGIIGLLSQTFTLVTSIGTMISSIIQNFQMAHLEKVMGEVEDNTRRLDISFEGAGLKYLFGIMADTDSLLGDFRGWFHDAFASLMTTTEDIDSTLKTMQSIGFSGGGGGGGSLPINFGSSGGSVTGSGAPVSTTGGGSTGGGGAPTPAPGTSTATGDQAFTNAANAIATSLGVNISGTAGQFNITGQNASQASEALSLVTQGGMSVSAALAQAAQDFANQSAAAGAATASTVSLGTAIDGATTGINNFTEATAQFGAGTSFQGGGTGQLQIAMTALAQSIQAALGVTVSGGLQGYTLSGNSANFSKATDEIAAFLRDQLGIPSGGTSTGGQVFGGNGSANATPANVYGPGGSNDPGPDPNTGVNGSTIWVVAGTPPKWVDSGRKWVGMGLTAGPTGANSAGFQISPYYGSLPTPGPVPTSGLPSSVLGNQSGAATGLNVVINMSGATIYGQQGADMVGNSITNALRTNAGLKLF